MQTPRVPPKRQVIPRRLLSAAAGAALVVLGGVGCELIPQPTGNLLPPPECADGGSTCYEESINAGNDAGADAGEELLDGGESPDTDAGEDSDAGTPDAG